MKAMKNQITERRTKIKRGAEANEKYKKKDTKEIQNLIMNYG